jgi:hypothetical protein
MAKLGVWICRPQTPGSDNSTPQQKSQPIIQILKSIAVYLQSGSDLMLKCFAEICCGMKSSYFTVGQHWNLLFLIVRCSFLSFF